MRRAVFLDKDGTLIEDVLHTVDPAHIKLTARRIIADDGAAANAAAGEQIR